jgi:hypothetical protein
MISASAVAYDASGGTDRNSASRPPVMLAPANAAARKPMNVMPSWMTARNRPG